MNPEVAEPEPTPRGRRAPRRQPLGGDLFFTTFPDEADRLQIDAGFDLPGWRPRPPSQPGRPQHPGTAVLFQDRWFEIRRRDLRSHRLVYRLAPWTESQTIRHAVELTPEQAEAWQAAHREQQRQRGRQSRLGLILPLLGLLPAEDQTRLEKQYGLDLGRATTISAIVLGSFSCFALMVVFALSKGFDLEDWRPMALILADWWPIWLFLAVESLFRIGSALALGEPIGSAVVTLPLAALRRLAGRRRSLEGLPPAPTAPTDSEARWLQEIDEVRQLEPLPDGRHRLEVRSKLPKEHWLRNVHGIDFDDRRYALAERIQATDDGPQHLFVLEEVGTDHLFRAIHAYRPEEVREVYKQQKRQAAATWIGTFGPFLGFTAPDLQRELEDTFGYLPWRNTKLSTTVGLVTGMIAVANAWWQWDRGQLLGSHALFAFLGLALIWESAVRRHRLSAGELTGGLLGSVVAPLVRPALRWRPSPDWPYPDPR